MLSLCTFPIVTVKMITVVSGVFFYYLHLKEHGLVVTPAGDQIKCVVTGVGLAGLVAIQGE